MIALEQSCLPAPEWRLALPDRPFAWLVTAFRLARTRRVLAELPDHLLADIGVTRDEAKREASRPFWDIPTDRLPYGDR